LSANDIVIDYGLKKLTFLESESMQGAKCFILFVCTVDDDKTLKKYGCSLGVYVCIP